LARGPPGFGPRGGGGGGGGGGPPFRGGGGGDGPYRGDGPRGGLGSGLGNKGGPPLPPRVVVDRTKVCPLLLRVYVKGGAHHRIEDFAKRGQVCLIVCGFSGCVCSSQGGLCVVWARHAFAEAGSRECRRLCCVCR